MAAQSDRLSAIRNELNNLLEARIGDLMGAVRATRDLTRRLVATEEEIRRQTVLKEGLEAQLGPRSDNRELERVRENMDRLRSLRDELMGHLSNLKGEIGDE